MHVVAGQPLHEPPGFVDTLVTIMEKWWEFTKYTRSIQISPPCLLTFLKDAFYFPVKSFFTILWTVLCDERANLHIFLAAKDEHYVLRRQILKSLMFYLQVVLEAGFTFSCSLSIYFSKCIKFSLPSLCLGNFLQRCYRTIAFI